MASIRKRRWQSPDGSWNEAYAVDYRDQGGKRRSAQFKRKHEAEAHKRKVEREIFEGVHTPGAAALTFAKLASLYLDDCDRRKRVKDKMAGATWTLARRFVEKHLVPRFGAMKASDITSKSIRDYVNGLSETYARVTVIKIVVTLRAVLQFGVAEGYLKRNIVRDDPPRITVEAAERTEIPDLAGLGRLVETVETYVHGPVYILPGMARRMSGDGPLYLAAATYLALTGGLRIGEICGLQWENVDFAASTIRVRHSLSRFDGLKGPKTKAGIRDVPLVPMLETYLKLLWERHDKPTSGFVIRTIAGTHYGTDGMSTNLWRPLAVAAGLLKKDGTPMGMHAIRHAAASLWIRARVGDLALTKAIGHSSVATTKDVYGHLFTDDGADSALIAGSTKELIPAGSTRHVQHTGSTAT